MRNKLIFTSGRHKVKLNYSSGFYLSHLVYSISRLRLLMISIFALATFLCPTPAMPQGYMVKPMSIEMSPRVGERVTKLIQLRNTMAKNDIELQITPMQLGQDEQGNWMLINLENASNSLKSRFPSCVDWIGLSNNTILVSPLATETIQLSLNIPLSARGFYGAVLVIQSVPEPSEEKVGVISLDLVVRFLVPVFVQIKGSSARTKVELTDVGMLYVPESEGPADSRGIYHASTKVNFTLRNTGETMARVGGRVTVFRQAGDRWRRITEAKMREKRIIPGVSFTIAEDISRRLPAGKYRIDATASIDGRPLRTLSREIDYEGDPEATTIAADVPLVIDPTDLEIRGVPGATRTILMTVENPSEEKLRVTCSATQPKGLRGVSLGETLGDDYSCNEWVSVKPDIFFLRGGSQRKVRIQLAYPRDINDQPFYYSSLNILAEYTDGQSAGNAEALIIGGNQKGESAPAMQGMGMSLSKLEEDKYAISAAFGNVGNVHLNPKCNGRVTDATGMKLIKNFSLVKQSGLVLPLGTSRFGGTIDFVGVRPGICIINVKVEFAEQIQTQTMNVRVTRGQEYNLVEIIEKQ